MLNDNKFLLECFVYENGKLYWNKRPVYHFKTESSFKAFNTKSSGKEVGTLNAYGYLSLRVTYKGKVVNSAVHRVIYAMSKGGIPEGFDVDHIDGDPSNNRTENLRAVNRQRNIGNMKICKEVGRMSGAYKVGNKWKSQIKIGYKMYYLGRFNTELDAHRAYLEARKVREELGL